ncbi:cAMP-binding protein [Enterobacteriaceae bacterium 89]|nr:cAMP-binding protein [Enterobacteriaceae bacterium 89]
MLNTYVKKTRPESALQSIISATAGCEEKTLKKWARMDADESGCIYVVLKGEVEVRRRSDDLCIAVAEKQFVYGIADFFDEESNVYLLVRADTVIQQFDKQQFEQVVAANALWPELGRVLAWYMALLSKRDDVLIARTAYTIIREYLIEINELTLQYGRDINVYDYIQEYTSLARSTIVKILAELKKGEYIAVKNGKLLSLGCLPEKY